MTRAIRPGHEGAVHELADHPLPAARKASSATLGSKELPRSALGRASSRPKSRTFSGMALASQRREDAWGGESMSDSPPVCLRGVPDSQDFATWPIAGSAVTGRGSGEGWLADQLRRYTASMTTPNPADPPATSVEPNTATVRSVTLTDLHADRIAAAISAARTEST